MGEGKRKGEGGKIYEEKEEKSCQGGGRGGIAGLENQATHPDDIGELHRIGFECPGDRLDGIQDFLKWLLDLREGQL